MQRVRRQGATSVRRTEQVQRTMGIAAAALAVLLASPPASEAICASPQFRALSPINLAVGSYPYELAAGDFNADGWPDLAVAKAFGDDVSVALGMGTGSFGAPTDFAVGEIPLSVAVGDLNADGHRDLITANANSNDVSILLGTGSGSFGAATSFPVASGPRPYPRSVALADFNADGRQDLAVADAFSNDVSILLGSGAGTVAASVSFAAGSSPSCVRTGDFNADGHEDLVVTNANGSNVSILLGAGTGAFGPATNFAVGTAPFYVAVADFNADGHEDLAVANRASNNVSVLLGTGTGSFGAPTNFAAGVFPQSVVAGDFNVDGILDLAVANQSTNNVSILLGTGTGSFGPRTNFAAGAAPQSVVAADFNADGTLDLAVANQNTHDVSILLNTCTQLAQGEACTDDADCASGFCADGVCCNSACGGGQTDDCEACAVAFGAAVNGTCGSASSSTVCRPSIGACDPAETCDGLSLVCPANDLEMLGAQPPGCNGALACNGSGMCLLAAGGACTLNSQCASGACFAGICLAQAPTMTPTETPTSAPTATPTPTPTPTVIPGCPPLPETGCRTAIKSRLLAKNSDDDTQDKLVWKWIKGQPTSQGELGDPTATAPYRLCVYAGTPSVLVGQAVIPAGTSRWSVISTKGFKYSDPRGTADGITKALVSGSEEEKSKALVKGKGIGLPDLPFGSITAPLTVQLVNIRNGLCLGESYAAPEIVINDAGKIRAQAP